MSDYAYVAFLDILGYKDLLAKDVGEGSYVFRDKMIRAFRCFDSVNQSRYSYKAISDSIFICFAEREQIEELLDLIKNVFVSFLKEGLLVRGGLSFGEHFQNQTITYSPVLTKAYSLESNVAEFPRVMIDVNIVEMFEHLKSNMLIHRSGENWFLRIADNTNFSQVWEAARETCLSSKESIDKVERVRIKHRWLQEYLCQIARDLHIQPPSNYIDIYDSHK